MAITAERRTKRATKKQDDDTGEAKKRHRRSPNEMIQDLETEIARLKTKAAAKEAKQSEEGKAFLAAVKVVDKAIVIASEAGDKQMVHALESARATLGEHLVRMGVRAPAIRGPKKRRSSSAD